MNLDLIMKSLGDKGCQSLVSQEVKNIKIKSFISVLKIFF